MVNDEDDLRRAQLIAAVRDILPRMAPAIDGALRSALGDEAEEQAAEAGLLKIQPARIVGLANSLAWHERRQTPARRLDELRAEIDRLAAKSAPGSQAATVYAFLRARLGLGQQPGDDEAQVLRELRFAPAERERWEGLARLLLAQTAVQLMELLARGDPLRQELEDRGGRVRLEPE